jgi:hypothetical protein
VTTEQVSILIVAAVVGLGSLLAALLVWRRLASVSRGLQAASVRAQERVVTVPARLVDARQRIAEAGAQAEHALWMLDDMDARMEHATADLIAKRDASDRLRVRLIAGQLSLARIRELVRLAVRLSELRRTFL